MRLLLQATAVKILLAWRLIRSVHIDSLFDVVYTFACYMDDSPRDTLSA
jgi:hypothetical protein